MQWTARRGRSQVLVAHASAAMMAAQNPNVAPLGDGGLCATRAATTAVQPAPTSNTNRSSADDVVSARGRRTRRGDGAIPYRLSSKRSTGPILPSEGV
jgi:hypothetical protein